ncbi:unnamed protein product [Amoebophrya sp. A120]|nr:unnamed protein product [Amoebophrya sp. A120]|eukprot:GSA120T00003050001.1
MSITPRMSGAEDNGGDAGSSTPRTKNRDGVFLSNTESSSGNPVDPAVPTSEKLDSLRAELKLAAEKARKVERRIDKQGTATEDTLKLRKKYDKIQKRVRRQIEEETRRLENDARFQRRKLLNQKAELERKRAEAVTAAENSVEENEAQKTTLEAELVDAMDRYEVLTESLKGLEQVSGLGDDSDDSGRPNEDSSDEDAGVSEPRETTENAASEINVLVPQGPETVEESSANVSLLVPAGVASDQQQSSARFPDTKLPRKSCLKHRKTTHEARRPTRRVSVLAAARTRKTALLIQQTEARMTHHLAQFQQRLSLFPTAEQQRRSEGSRDSGHLSSGAATSSVTSPVHGFDFSQPQSAPAIRVFAPFSPENGFLQKATVDEHVDTHQNASLPTSPLLTDDKKISTTRSSITTTSYLLDAANRTPQLQCENHSSSQERQAQPSSSEQLVKIHSDHSLVGSVCISDGEDLLDSAVSEVRHNEVDTLLGSARSTSLVDNTSLQFIPAKSVISAPIRGLVETDAEDFVSIPAAKNSVHAGQQVRMEGSTSLADRVSRGAIQPTEVLETNAIKRGSIHEDALAELRNLQSTSPLTEQLQGRSSLIQGRDAGSEKMSTRSVVTGRRTGAELVRDVDLEEQQNVDDEVRHKITVIASRGEGGSEIFAEQQESLHSLVVSESSLHGRTPRDEDHDASLAEEFLSSKNGSPSSTRRARRTTQHLSEFIRGTQMKSLLPINAEDRRRSTQLESSFTSDLEARHTEQVSVIRAPEELLVDVTPSGTAGTDFATANEDHASNPDLPTTPVDVLEDQSFVIDYSTQVLNKGFAFARQATKSEQLGQNFPHVGQVFQVELELETVRMSTVSSEKLVDVVDAAGEAKHPSTVTQGNANKAEIVHPRSGEDAAASVTDGGTDARRNQHTIEVQPDANTSMFLSDEEMKTGRSAVDASQTSELTPRNVLEIDVEAVAVPRLDSSASSASARPLVPVSEESVPAAVRTSTTDRVETVGPEKPLLQEKPSARNPDIKSTSAPPNTMPLPPPPSREINVPKTRNPLLQVPSSEQSDGGARLSSQPHSAREAKDPIDPKAEAPSGPSPRPSAQTPATGFVASSGGLLAEDLLEKAIKEFDTEDLQSEVRTFFDNQLARNESNLHWGRGEVRAFIGELFAKFFDFNFDRIPAVSFRQNFVEIQRQYCEHLDDDQLLDWKGAAELARKMLVRMKFFRAEFDNQRKRLSNRNSTVVGNKS